MKKYLIRYWLIKKELYAIHNQAFPLGMDHILHDCIESHRPKLRIAQTLDEVNAAIEKIEIEAMEKLEQMGFQVCEEAQCCSFKQL